MNGIVRSDEIEIRLLLEAINQKYHYDFRNYSPASLKRRLSQARDRLACPDFSSLQERLLRESGLLPRLLDFMTVQVSDMFRDPEYFLSIRRNVLPHLKTYPSLKVWVAGCSTGEEFYSLAILFREEGLEARTIFYATDINAAALEKARAGVYDMERVADFSRNHLASGGKAALSDYYSAAYGSVIFDKSLRERAVFSDHSLVSDSVFAEVHLVSCRNVLIYFNRQLQDRAVGLFKDSLVRKGFLWLGARESLRFSSHCCCFSQFDAAARIYQKEEDS